MLDADGVLAQRAWSCPSAGFTPKPLSVACKGALVAVHRLVGADPAEELFDTCPCHTVRSADAHTVASLLAWYHKGQLALRVPHPSGALVDAIDCADAALERRKAEEIRRQTAARKESP